jgi:hypothetical protein
VVRGLSGYVDNLFGGVMAKAFEDLLHIDVPFLSPYIDFFAFALSIIFSGKKNFLLRKFKSHNIAK